MRGKGGDGRGGRGRGRGGERKLWNTTPFLLSNAYPSAHVLYKVLL